MKYQQALHHMYSLAKFGKLGLRRIRKLLKKLGNPEKKLRIIHVAGSNGKGSVCAMIAAILEEAGFRVGLFTSPHLVRFTERIKINNTEISRKDVLKYFKKVNKQFEEQSFFEFITAMALLYFHDKKVDCVVLETGLGGRLDATNVVKPVVSVITTVSLEHQNVLGKTLSKIAREKAGIIKRGVPVVTGAQGVALQEIRRRAAEKNAPFSLSKKCDHTTNLLGDVQKSNVCVAVETIHTLNKRYNLRVTEKAIKKGLMKVTWSGRIQYLSKDLLVDCAHNLAGMRALVDYLRTLNRKIVLVFGCSADKDYKKIIQLLMPLVKKVIATRAVVEYRTNQGLDPAIIAEEIRKHTVESEVIGSVPDAIKQAQRIAKKELIVVTGSLFVVGEVMASRTW